jgi:nitroreductase
MRPFLELAKDRRSVRDYSARPIAREDLELCVEAARYSPSACNSQPWKFIIVDDPKIRAKVAGTFAAGTFKMNSFVHDAAAFIAVVSEKQKFIPWLGGKLGGKDYRRMDIGIASAHIVLEAEELGIGTCMLGWYDEKKLAGILALPPAKSIEIVISLGYPREEGPVTGERKIKEKYNVVSFNRY